MAVLPIITGCLNSTILALTPVERWKAVKSFPKCDFMADDKFALFCIILLVVLILLLSVVSYHRAKQERKLSNRLFIEYAQERGLTIYERRILLEVAYKAGLNRSESIFTLDTVFDRGAAIILKESQLVPEAAEESSRLKAELSFLREKLGFNGRNGLSANSSVDSVERSSRQIPIGKKIYITHRKTPASGNIEATVVKNSDDELAVCLTKPMKITFGEVWCVRYYSGSSVWEFDTSIISYDGDILVLSHSDDVKFINRRRFSRAPVIMSAFIACFPFEKLSVKDRQNGKNGLAADHNLTKTSAVWGPPEFVPAVVTELAGPGLRLESSLDVKTGDRILVIFNLEQEPSPESYDKKTITLRIGEAVGEVRHTKPTQNGLSIAVELTGLSDSNIDELICATNAALLSATDRNKNESALENAVKRIPAQAGVQGGQDV